MRVGPASGAPPPEGSRMSQQRSNYSDTAAAIIGGLNAEGSSAMEKDFTPIYGKLLKFKQDLLGNAAIVAAAASASKGGAEKRGPSSIEKAEGLIEAVSHGKKLMRPFKECKKSNKGHHLDSMLEHVQVVAKYFQDDGVELGPWIGSCLARATFRNASKEGDPITASERLSVQNLSCAAPSKCNFLSPAQVVIDCLATKIFSMLSESVHAGLAESTEAWARAKGHVCEVAIAYAQFINNSAGTFSGLDIARGAFDALRCICKAALKLEGVSPGDLSRAVGIVDSEVIAVRFHEGFKHGVGAGIMADAKELLVEGELDEQCVDDLMSAAESTLAVGFDENIGEGSLVVDGTGALLDNCPEDFIRIMDETMRQASSALSQISHFKLTCEAEVVVNVIAWLGEALALRGGYRSHHAAVKLRAAREAWGEKGLAQLDGERWPPAGLPAGALSDQSFKENPLAKLCVRIAKFCDVAFKNIIKWIPDGSREARERLAEEAQRVETNINVRRALWEESPLLSTLVHAPWRGGQDFAAMDMGVTSGEGTLATLIKIAEVRNDIAECTESGYVIEKVVIDKVPGLESSLPFSCKQSTGAFSKQWLKGESTNLLLEKYLFSNVEKMVSSTMHQYDSLFKKARTTTGWTHAIYRKGEGALDMMGSLVGKAVIQSTAESVDLLELASETPVADLPLTFKFANRVALNSMTEVISPCPQERRLSSSIDLSGKPLKPMALMVTLEMLDHVGCTVQVASVLAHKLQTPGSVVVKVSACQDTGGDKFVVSPWVNECAQWLFDGGGVNWAQVKNRVSQMAADVNMKYSVSELESIVMFAATVVAPLARERALDACLAKLKGIGEELKGKTPQYSHILTGTRYNASPAKKQLTNETTLQSVGALIDMAEEYSSDINKQFGITEEGVNDHPVLVEVDGVVDAAKTAMCVCAAVNTVEHFSKSADGPKMAQDILDNKEAIASVPGVLKTKLGALAKTS
ncbi:unnamed protein product [Prorocentrum cordatum]|uniref:Uncharacterized protein n=1 Tax=Prorocentrum cordatum TaxID=2364126 RepID=A0ABN9TTC3_9DINO|nr:unnamed protein product [Polarella glacialis]